LKFEDIYFLADAVYSRLLDRTRHFGSFQIEKLFKENQISVLYIFIDALPILQVFPLKKHVEVSHFYHRYSSTVSDGI